eukprot:TRINITY_DN587_c0_g1_i1.p1 TRINITY_DN587_c0_g1~~TRINITY_DN587_c0_g1_i1.p1  ORF type:complete len:333 (-),score=61.73 TRINITY_DN587_c0_g1_i1:46-1023(-)
MMSISRLSSLALPRASRITHRACNSPTFPRPSSSSSSSSSSFRSHYVCASSFSSTPSSSSSDPQRPLAGRRAIVTGSTSGIGLGVANHLASQGCSVLLNGFGDADLIKQTVKEVGARNNVKTSYHGADVGDFDQISDMVDHCVSELGGVDILVNNAGIQHVASVSDFPVDQWKRVMDINLNSVFYGTKCVLPHFRKANWGRIVNISSVHGLVGSVNKSAYVAAKHGVMGLTKVTALETAEEDITCNAVNPGWVLTPLVEKQIETKAAEMGVSIEDATRALLGEKQPSLQFVSVEQLAGTVSFLCSDAASQITGIPIPVDGGWTAR